MDRVIRFAQYAVLIVLVLWVGQYIKNEFFDDVGPLDAVGTAVSETASWLSGLAHVSEGQTSQQNIGSGPHKLLVELDPTLSSAARARVAKGFATVWPNLVKGGDLFLIHHRYYNGRDVAVWAVRNEEETVRGSGEGLALYVKAAESAPHVAEAPPALPPESDSSDGGPSTGVGAPAPAPSATLAPPEGGASNSIMMNVSGNLPGYNDYGRVKFLAVTEDLSEEEARTALMADGYNSISDVGDDVLMGLDVQEGVVARLSRDEEVIAPLARGLLIPVILVLLVLSVLLGAKGTRWALTVEGQRDPPFVVVQALYRRLRHIEARGVALVDRTGLWVWRLFVWFLLLGLLLVILAGGIPSGAVWLPVFLLLGVGLMWVRLHRIQRALVATVARSMQLHDFDEEAVNQFARANATLINEGAERIVEPYFSIGTASEAASNKRLVSFWTQMMGRDPGAIETLLTRQKDASLSLVRYANTIGPVSSPNEEAFVAGVPISGPAFGMIRKGYRGSAGSKTAEGGEDPELTGKPAVVKMVLTVVDAFHTWLDDMMLANRAKRLANAVMQRRLLGEALQDARTLTEDLEARSVKRALEHAELGARLSDIRRTSRQKAADAEADFEHAYDDEEPDGPLEPQGPPFSAPAEGATSTLKGARATRPVMTPSQEARPAQEPADE